MPFIVDGTNGGFFPSWTTATRPATPANGQMGYNTTTGLFDQYVSSGWAPVAAAGTVLQVVQATYTTATTTTSTTPVTTGISVTITPKFATSKVLILHQGMINSQGASNWADYTLYRNSTNLYTNGRSSAGGLYINGSADYHAPTGIVCLDSPATTSATTYTVYFKTGNGAITVRYNSDSWLTNIVAMEIAS